jgi:hypothetical protein
MAVAEHQLQTVGPNRMDFRDAQLVRRGWRLAAPASGTLAAAAQECMAQLLGAAIGPGQFQHTGTPVIRDMVGNHACSSSLRGA